MQKLLNEKQVSELTGRAVTTLQKDRLKGIGLRYVRLGRLVRYRPQDVEAWIEQNLRCSTSDPGPDFDQDA